MRSLTFIAVIVLAISACGDSDIGVDPETTPRVSTTTSAAVTATTEDPVVPSDTTTTTELAVTTTTVPLRSLDAISLAVEEAGSGFTQPVLMLPEPATGRWFVVDQPGVLWAIQDGEAVSLLDINELVLFRGEQGLLGLAFHPDYQANGLVYLNYINNDGDTVVASAVVTGAVPAADTLTEILRVDQPAGNHNGGMLAFGPDGNLWIGFGDGGGADDRFGHGQRADTLLAAMVRISVGPEIDGYGIPDGNLADEIWAIGLRNPWRFTFDGEDLWIADVGQNRIEEIDVVSWQAGNPNFGWPILEGSECFSSSDCDRASYSAPIYEYTHSDGCSITGGFVYRGEAVPELDGQYFFSDYCSGWLRSVDRQGVMREWLPAGTLSGVIGFGEDAAGELYVLTTAGSIYAIREAS